VAKTSENGVQTTDGSVVAIPAHQQWVNSLDTRARMVDNSSRGMEITANQVDKIMAAETEDDIWDADSSGAISGMDLQDVILEVHSYDVAKSTKVSDDGGESLVNHYFLIQATRYDTKSPEDIVVNCGAPLVMAKLDAFRAKAADVTDMKLMCVIKGTSTQGGNTVLRLARAPQLPTRA
jgi:hypothetical protein